MCVCVYVCTCVFWLHVCVIKTRVDDCTAISSHSQAYAKEMEYLASKVAAGADVIITQMVFDADVYATFVRDCRAAGITVPIIPGIMCINVSSFLSVTSYF